MAGDGSGAVVAAIWCQGRRWWVVPRERFSLVRAGTRRARMVAAWYNTGRLSADPLFDSYWDLLEPEFAYLSIGSMPGTDQGARWAGMYIHPDIGPEWVAKVDVGDVSGAGEDCGCGSSREHAVWALRGAGVRAVIADSLARIFFRNAVNNGFPALEIPGISGRIADGDEIEILLDEGLVWNRTQKRGYSFSPYRPCF